MLVTSSALLGLDVGSSTLKAVALRRENGKVSVERAALAAMPGGAVSGGTLLDPSAVATAIRDFCRREGFRGGRVAVAVGGDDVFLARLRLSRSGGPWTDQVLAEASRILPFPREQANVDYRLVEETAEAAEALLAAVKREKVEVLRDVLRRAGKTPAILDVAACALVNAFEFNYQPDPESLAALAHVGAGTVTVAIVRGGRLLLARDLPLAHGGFAEPDWPVAERVAVQLERVFEQLDEIADQRPLEPRSGQIGRVWLSGGGASMPGIEESLRERLRRPVESMNPFRRIEHQGSERSTMAVAVGLALRAWDET